MMASTNLKNSMLEPRTWWSSSGAFRGNVLFWFDEQLEPFVRAEWDILCFRAASAPIQCLFRAGLYDFSRMMLNLHPLQPNPSKQSGVKDCFAEIRRSSLNKTRAEVLKPELYDDGDSTSFIQELHSEIVILVEFCTFLHLNISFYPQSSVWPAEPH